MSLAKLLRKIPLFVGFGPSEFESLEKCLVRRRYPAGQALFHMGDEGGSLHLIERGRVKITIPSSSGEELILAIRSAGDLLGELSLFDGKSRSATVLALEETVTLCLRRDDLLALMRKRFDVVEKILEVLARKIRETDMLLADVHFLDITSRLAKKILDLGDTFGIREGGQVRIGVKITQKDLASMIGATRESINKQLKSLRDQGLVRISGGTIEILNRERLVQKARIFPKP
ncbi:MAG: Crp/Fnr family transcriptional regulator [candidate division NC10 bacterium]|nr:Crp/Fnr family transcriptional regulator [candidate division NC10 bacterium]